MTSERGARHAPYSGLPASLTLQIPAPQFATKIPADRRPGTPASTPGAQPDPHGPHESANVEHQPRPVPLPVRSPGTHLHPLLRRPPVTGSARGESR